MEITYWHRLAQLYQNKELELSEIAKVWIINTAIGVIEDYPDMTKVGINVLDNSQINNTLVFGILHHHPEEELISYPEIGRMLKIHAQTVGKGVKQLVADGIINKEDFGSSGSTYTILRVPIYPKWIMHFTKAIIELEYDEEGLRDEVIIQCEKIHFRRGMEILKEELRNKFYRRKKL